MKTTLIALLSLLAGQAQAAKATLHCSGYQVETEPKITVEGTLELEDGKPVSATLLLEPLGKNGWTYLFNWREVAQKNSNFGRWFDYESTAENIMIKGLYAGLSPELTESYSLYQAVKEGTPFEGVPLRTLILYGQNKKPYAETFCYEAAPKLKAN